MPIFVLFVSAGVLFDGAFSLWVSLKLKNSSKKHTDTFKCRVSFKIVTVYRLLLFILKGLLKTRSVSFIANHVGNNCDALLDLVLFWQFKKRQRHPWKSVASIKLVGSVAEHACLYTLSKCPGEMHPGSFPGR